MQHRYKAREGLMMDAIERATRWFFAGRNAWVLWPVGIIAVVLAIAATGVLSGLLLARFSLSSRWHGLWGCSASAPAIM